MMSIAADLLVRANAIRDQLLVDRGQPSGGLVHSIKSGSSIA
jgi:hypothetical protein